MFLTLAAPLLASFDPMQTGSNALHPPDTTYLLGTDLLGRDVFSRVLFGGRQTLAIALLATGIAGAVGLLLGIMGGLTTVPYVDSLSTSIINTLLALPGLMIALVILTLLGQGSWQVALATGIAQIAPFARVARAAILTVRTTAYIESAVAVGAPHHHILRRHILPNASPTILGYAGVTFGYSILNATALSFLGFGGDLGVPDWGVILAEARLAFRSAPWIGIMPGILIFLTVWSVNRLADDLAMVRR